VSPLLSHKLSVGQVAPDFSTTDVAGKKVALSKLDSRYVLLVFLRYSGCPWCNLAIHRLSLEYPTFQEHDCAVVAFIQSDKSDIISNIYERHNVKPKFPIIADHSRTFYKLYGVSTSLTAAARSITKIPAWVHAVKRHGFKQTHIDGNLFIVPASFLIDNRTHKIAQVNYNADFYQTEAFIDIYQSVFFREL
jgi:peroxiredoxin Q/BCP